VIDCHFHLWTSDVGTPEKRAERADQVRAEADRLGVERIALIGEVGTTIEACREHNRTVAAFVDEHPDLFYGWARVDPRLGEDAVAEFRRAVTEDGLVGLKHHFNDGTPVNVTDPSFEPLAAAAVDLDAPVITHCMDRVPADRERWDDSEANSDDVVALAREFPDLTLISAHLVAGNRSEYRIKNVADQENVIIDVSGSNFERDYVEQAAERLGTDRLVFGTDTWFIPGVGKLLGCDLAPEEKAEIAYNFERLLPDTVPNALSAEELAERRAAAEERFAAADRPREEPLVDANAYLGNWPHREVSNSSAEGLLAHMDRKGVDRALVSAIEATLYRDVHAANRLLRDRVEGNEDRLLPVATVNPAYPEWEADLETAIEDWGFRAAKLLPTYHEYDLDDPAAIDCLQTCAELDVPVVVVALVEDYRCRHPRITLTGYEDGGDRSWTDEHLSALETLLREAPATDVVLGNSWGDGPDLVDRLHQIQRNGVHLDNQVRSGRTLLAVNDLFVYFSHQGEAIAEQVGAEHLAYAASLPFKIVDSSLGMLDALDLDASDREQVTAGNVDSML
jgi:predicted TIM-barrel fold metal-dependent hydrolase